MLKRSGRMDLARAASILFAAATLLFAAALIAQCAAIYRAGVAPENFSAGVYVRDVYSPAIVSARFAQIAWTFYLWLGALACAIAARVFRCAPALETCPPSPADLLALFAARVSPTPAMCAERRFRRIATAICAAVCAVCAGFAVFYLTDLRHFESRDLEAVMGAMLWRVAPLAALFMTSLVARAVIVQGSVRRELDAAKHAPARQNGTRADRESAPTDGRVGARTDVEAARQDGDGRSVGAREPEPRATRSRTPVKVARAALLLCAALFIALGVANGGMYDVLVKAVNICTECIGLG